MTHISLSPIQRGFAPSFVNYKKGALDSQLQVIKFTSYLLMMFGGSLRVLRLLPPLKLVAMILLKVALNTRNNMKSNLLLSSPEGTVFLYLTRQHYRKTVPEGKDNNMFST
jgi:hypothetical protein